MDLSTLQPAPGMSKFYREVIRAEWRRILGVLFVIESIVASGDFISSFFTEKSFGQIVIHNPLVAVIPGMLAVVWVFLCGVHRRHVAGPLAAENKQLQEELSQLFSEGCSLRDRTVRRSDGPGWEDLQKLKADIKVWVEKARTFIREKMSAKESALFDSPRRVPLDDMAGYNLLHKELQATVQARLDRLEECIKRLD